MRCINVLWANFGVTSSQFYYLYRNFNNSIYSTFSDENIEVARLSHVCWLDVRGKLTMSELSPGVIYEIVYVVKLTKEASGWELPIRLKLSLPGGRDQERQVSLLEKPRKQWIELNVGNFESKDGETGEVCFDLFEHGTHWKGGLIIKGAILRPKKQITLLLNKTSKFI